MKGYTNQASVQSLAGDTTLTISNAQIEMAEAFVDNFTGRNFIADSVASLRYYDGDNSASLMIDDCVAISKLEFWDGSGWVEITDYDKYPINKLPYNMIYLDTGYFLNGIGNYRVTAKWGYSVAVPADVGLASSMFILSTLGFKNIVQDIKSENLGTYSVSYGDGTIGENRIKAILMPYKKISL